LLPILKPEFVISPVKAEFNDHFNFPFPHGNLHSRGFQEIYKDGCKSRHTNHNARNS
jgi:hypothetical protein